MDNESEDGVKLSSLVNSQPHGITPRNKRVSLLLKRQKGKCPHCKLFFKVGDLMEVDHITPRSAGGKDEYQNLQLLHRHCHDTKSAQERANGGVCMTNTTTLRSRVMCGDFAATDHPIPLLIDHLHIIGEKNITR